MDPDQPQEPEFDRPATTPEGSSPVVKVLIGTVGLAAVGALVVWLVGEPTPAGDTLAEVPLVTADTGPTKRQPEEPGGVAIPNQDKLVYGIIDPDDGGEVVERLLPPPEEPVAVAPLPEPVAEPEPVAAPESELATAEGEALADIAPSAGEAAAVTGADEAATLTADGTAVPLPSAPSKTIAEAVAESEPAATFADAEAAVAALAEPPPPPAGGWRIQVGAFKVREQAEAEWARVVKKAGTLLAGLQPRIESVDLGVDQGIFHRLQVEPFADKAAAEDLCSKLSAVEVGCLVVKP